MAKETSARAVVQSGRQIGDVDKQIGQRIRYFRTKANLSQARLGERLGVSFQQIQKYERGLNRVSCSTLLYLSTELGVGPLDLLPDGPHSQASQLNHLMNDLSECIPLIEAFSNVKSAEVRRAILLCVQQMSAAAPR